MTVIEAIRQRRSIRKFSQQKISEDKLVTLVDCARLAAFGANLQPLKFGVITDKAKLCEVFKYIKWAAYLKDYEIAENERPTAYIAILGDRTIKAEGSFECDSGAAVTNILLAAQEMGIATCWLGAIDRNKIKSALSIDDNFDLVYLVALGYPAQKSEITQYTDSVKYYMDNLGSLKVPKRSIEDVLINL